MEHRKLFLGFHLQDVASLDLGKWFNLCANYSSFLYITKQVKIIKKYFQPAIKSRSFLCQES